MKIMKDEELETNEEKPFIFGIVNDYFLLDQNKCPQMS